MERLGSHLYEKITGKVVFFFCATHVIISCSTGEGGGRHLRPLLNLLGHLAPYSPSDDIICMPARNVKAFFRIWRLRYSNIIFFVNFI